VTKGQLAFKQKENKGRKDIREGVGEQEGYLGGVGYLGGSGRTGSKESGL